ncbi:MAG: hypothetical protein ACK5RL_02050 [Acidimicrobiales bacterium]
MRHLISTLNSPTDWVAVASYDGAETTIHGSSGATGASLPLGSFSKAVLALAMRHDRDFIRSRITVRGEAWPVSINDLLSHHRRVGPPGVPVYAYDDERFRLAVEHYLTRHQCSVLDLPAVVADAIGMRVTLIDPVRPERGLATSPPELRHMLAMARGLVALDPPTDDPSGHLLLGAAVSTPQFRTGSPFFWSDDPTLVLQHGGIVDRHAVLMVLAPALDRGFVLALHASDGAESGVHAQREVSARVCCELAIPTDPVTDRSRLHGHPDLEVDGLYSDGRDRLRICGDSTYVMVEPSDGPARATRRIGRHAFVDVAHPAPWRYAHTFFTPSPRPDDDRHEPVIGVVLDQRSYLRQPESESVTR